MIPSRLTAGRALTALVWPGNALPRGPLLACRWAIIKRDAVMDTDALKDLLEPMPDGPTVDPVKVESAWLVALNNVREPLPDVEIRADEWSQDRAYFGDLHVDAWKLSMLLAVAPARQFACVRGVPGKHGACDALLALDGDDALWLLLSLGPLHD